MRSPAKSWAQPAPNPRTKINDVLTIGLSVVFSTLTGIFGQLVGLVLARYTLGAIQGARSPVQIEVS